jgi:hypothetical protein
MLSSPSYRHGIARLLAGVMMSLLAASTAFAEDFPASVLPPFAPTFITDPPCAEPLLDNLSLLVAIDASREPQDLGVNANFGGFLAANTGFPLIEDIGLGGQIGTGVTLSRAGVKVLRVLEGTRARQQWFTTAGLFHRDEGWHAGLVCDLEVESYYDHFFTGQVRGEVGVELTAHDETGVWGSAGGFGDNGRVLTSEVHVKPLAEISLYWQHRWESGAVTRFWGGVTESHHTDIIDMPDLHATGPVANFGLEVFVPLNDYFAIFGQGHFITPSDTGTLDAYLGIVFYPGGGVSRARSNAYAPVLPVANNPTFPLDLRR